MEAQRDGSGQNALMQAAERDQAAQGRQALGAVMNESLRNWILERVSVPEGGANYINEAHVLPHPQPQQREPSQRQQQQNPRQHQNPRQRQPSHRRQPPVLMEDENGRVLPSGDDRGLLEFVVVVEVPLHMREILLRQHASLAVQNRGPNPVPNAGAIQNHVPVQNRAANRIRNRLANRVRNRVPNTAGNPPPIPPQPRVQQQPPPQQQQHRRQQEPVAERHGPHQFGQRCHRCGLYKRSAVLPALPPRGVPYRRDHSKEVAEIPKEVLAAPDAFLPPAEYRVNFAEAVSYNMMCHLVRNDNPQPLENNFYVVNRAPNAEDYVLDMFMDQEPCNLG